jgi:hypothetical protein
MDDFRRQLQGVIDAMLAEGVTPAFLVAELDGAEQIRRQHGIESLDKFKAAAINAVTSAAADADAFTYGDDRIVVILGAQYDRLKTFALIQKLRRVIPLLGQSFDFFVRPEFDVIEYDATLGVAGLINHIATRRIRDEHVA